MCVVVGAAIVAINSVGSTFFFIFAYSQHQQPQHGETMQNVRCVWASVIGAPMIKGDNNVTTEKSNEKRNESEGEKGYAHTHTNSPTRKYC